jgi:hypothetical protein
MFAAVSCSRRPGKTVGDLVMGGKEALNLPRRLEPLHDPLSSSNCTFRACAWQRARVTKGMTPRSSHRNAGVGFPCTSPVQRAFEKNGRDDLGAGEGRRRHGCRRHLSRIKEMMAQISGKDGFIAALDQSGGSTPRRAPPLRHPGQDGDAHLAGAFRWAPDQSQVGSAARSSTSASHLMRASGVS